MFGLRPKPAEVLSHWYAPVPNFSASTADFYTAVEKELKAQKVPGLAISRVELSEGGILTDNRQYLRMTRERLVFDICAAPFGANFFYSCRFAEMRPVLELWQLVLLVCAWGFFTLISLILTVKIFGLLAPFLWPPAYIMCLFLLFYALRSASLAGGAGLEALILQTPLIKELYEAWFRADTYYRQDARLMYLTVVEGVVKKLVEEQTAAKGVKLLTEYEHGPILGELYKPTVKCLDQKNAPKT